MKNLEYDTWYWVAHPHEGDIWYPVYVNSNFEYLLDGVAHPVLQLKDLIVHKAVMPPTDTGE